MPSRSSQEVLQHIVTFLLLIGLSTSIALYHLRRQSRVRVSYSLSTTSTGTTGRWYPVSRYTHSLSAQSPLLARSHRHVRLLICSARSCATRKRGHHRKTSQSYYRKHSIFTRLYQPFTCPSRAQIATERHHRLQSLPCPRHSPCAAPPGSYCTTSMPATNLWDSPQTGLSLKRRSCKRWAWKVLER